MHVIALMGRDIDAGPALPLDPDLDPAEDLRRRATGRRRRAGRRRRRRGGLPARLRPGVLAAIAAGGALGGGARYLIETAAPAGRGGFPWATFSINVGGAFALAVLLVFVLDLWPPTRHLRPFAAIGVLGSFTTFSTWMVETAELIADGRAVIAVGYLSASTLAGLAAVVLGLVLGRSVLTRREHAARSSPPAAAPAEPTSPAAAPAEPTSTRRD